MEGTESFFTDLPYLDKLYCIDYDSYEDDVTMGGDFG